MITTVTLNPAIDKTCAAARMLPGQVNRMERVTNIAGGKGINVAKVLLQYGYQVRTMGFLGGYTGDFIQQSIKALGADCKFTAIANDTRCNTNILSEDGYVTEILEPGPQIQKKEVEQFLVDYDRTLEECESVILSGSVPQGVPETIYEELICRANQKGRKVLFDSSGIFLKNGVRGVPFMIKPNRKELEILMGKKLPDREAIIQAALTLTETGIEHVLVSMGANGLLYVCHKDIFYARVPAVKAVNTVGCGDSVVASFAMSMALGEEREALLLRAAAISAANATTLESAVIPKERADEFYNHIIIERY